MNEVSNENIPIDMTYMFTEGSDNPLTNVVVQRLFLEDWTEAGDSVRRVYSGIAFTCDQYDHEREVNFLEKNDSEALTALADVLTGLYCGGI